jgi:hypothetical protein
MVPPTEKGTAGKGQLPMEKMKIAATVVIVVIALAMAYYFLVFQSGPASPKLGNPINLPTFATLLSQAQDVYVVMDVSNATGQVKQNVIECGVDFAGSPGLGGKNMTFFSIDTGGRCIGANGNYSSSWCFAQMENGLSIIIQPGNSTSFYTDAMVVGMGDNYTAGGCSVTPVQQ